MIIIKCREIIPNLKLSLAYLFLINLKNKIGNKVYYHINILIASAMNYPDFK